MSASRRLAERFAAFLVRNRSRLPGSLSRWIESAAKNPDGLAGRLAARALGGSPARPPAATSVPATDVRVYIGPTNYAGQGWEWARALERSSPRIGARNLSLEIPGTFAFPADSPVPLVVQSGSTTWQRAELEAVRRFTHVLFEAERPLFGPLLGRDIDRERRELEDAGVSVAFLAHGTDIRSPRRHRSSSPWSEFHDDGPEVAALQSDADRNLDYLRSVGRPVFVSTPDLLADAPFAAWCPVVVDVDRWAGGRPLLAGPVPVVAHAPSAARAKGTHLIGPVLDDLAQRGTLDYRMIHGIPSSRMPAIVGDADVVLDQFRTGSYGVGACEGMAAGRVVVGHVTEAVRDHVRAATGLELPVIEATPDTLRDVLTTLLADPDRVARTGVEGREFVRAVHAGPTSADVLRRGWIDVSP